MKHNNIFGDFIKRTAVLLSALFVIAATAWAETITLTSGTGEVTLQNGDVLTGTGGANTHVTIADGATVTLSNVEIITPDDINHMWAGITGAGNATIILVGTNTVKGGVQHSSICVPSGCTLTIQGNGSLTAMGGQRGAGIGSGKYGVCGNIIIEGGNITATGDDFCAGIGSTGSSSCGNITITGGNVTATGGYHAAGIGTGEYESSCGNITITGGNVTVFGGYNAAGIGTGVEKTSCGNITITSGVTALAVTVSDKVDAIGKGYNSRDCSVGTITIAGTEMGNITQNPFIYNPSDDTPYTVTFNANGGTGEMDEQVFISNKPQALPACAFNYDQYHAFVGWNTAADGSGISFTDRKNICNLGNVTLYAQWQAIGYGITYTNAVDGENCVTNTNPTSYTYDSGNITLTDPVRPGYTFDGWTWKGQGTPTKDVTIPSGSSGGRTFTAHWSFNPIATITTSTREALLLDGHTLTGTGGSNTHVTIAAGATVTLSDVNITSINAKPSCTWEGITCEGDATIILKDGTTNAVTGGYRSSGIFVAESHTLTIQGNGSLTATGHDYAAGIGSGFQGTCGNIVIAGGTIAATGGLSAAGIGCGQGTTTGNSTCGDITIARTVTSVTATKGKNAIHSIGKGQKYGKCGTVTISGKATGPISGDSYTYAPGGSLNSTIHFDKNGGSGTMDDWIFTWDGTEQPIPTCTFTAPEGKMFVGWSTEPDGSGTYYTKQVIDVLSGTLYAIWKEPTESVPNGELTLYDDQILTGTGGTKTHVTIADGATVTLSSVNISISAAYEWAGITCAGDATIILSGDNTVKGGHESAGIFVPEGRTLTIKGEGSLTATSNYAAGIGCGGESSCGNIVIEGGTITATGKDYAAGIGSGEKGSCGNIVIKGGTITATGNTYAAGIGCGNKGSCGNIVIESGTVTATGGLYAPGIGSGYGSSEEQASCGDITIARKVINVTVTKGKNALHSIGEGKKYSICGTVTIGGATGPISESTYIYNPNGSLESTIHFDKNNGNATGSMDDWHFTWDGQEHAIPACTFTGPEGTIMRWNTKADGSGIYYTNGQNVIDILSGTLYAIWHKPEESVPNGELTLYDGQILEGTGDKKTHVTIADGATVTLRGVNITQITNGSSCQWAGITCLGDATIILSGVNTVKGGYESAGIFVPEGRTLTIKGVGSLTATGRDYAAGIGSGKEGTCGDIVIEGGNITATGGFHAAGIGSGEEGSCGNIVIEGGNITATGGSNAAGIGSGYDSSSAPSSCGDITIARTVTSVTATKGNNAIHSIGKGYRYGTCGTVTIGWATGPISESPYTYTPSGSMTSTVHFEANNGSSETMDDWLFTYDGAAHAIPLCTFTTPEDMLFTGWNTAADGSGTYYENGQRIIDIPDGTLYAVWRPFIEEITTNTGALKMYDGQMLTGTGGTETHITIDDKATVTLSGVDITSHSSGYSHPWAGITCLGDATIILKGYNAVKGGYHSAGIFVPEGHTLTILGDGTLRATGRDGAAGIGSGYKDSCGNIIIESGTIIALGGDGAAGIGSGYGTESTQSSCGDITINGGAIIATGYEENMGIGSGVYGTCGTITINGSLIDKTIEKTRYITVPDWTGTISVKLAKEGYGTYYTGVLDLVMPAGIKAHIVTASANGGQLTYETIADGNTSNNTVPAKTGVMLQATAADNVQTVDIGIMVPTADAISQTNLLGGSDKEKNITEGSMDTKYYKLTYNQNGENLGWYWGNKNGTAFITAPNKAWLALPPTAAAREFFGLPEEEETTSLSEELRVKSEESDNVIYNLAGQKLSRLQKGINIINGKKVLF